LGILKVKPWGKDQGDFVIIDEENFDSDFHELFEKPEPKQRKKKASEKDKE
jgi:hypothetical protein